MMYCEHGPALDENNCPLPCGCANPPVVETTITPVKCRPCLTALACQFGFLLDDFGCSTCRCNSQKNWLSSFKKKENSFSPNQFKYV